MSQSSGNSPIDRVIAWFRGKLGGGTGTSASGSSTTSAQQAAPSSTQQEVDRANEAMRDRARDLARPLEDDPAATTTPAPSTQQRVETINDQMRENVRNLARPMEADTGDDLATTTDRPGDMGTEPEEPADLGQPTGASSDEFAGGGYTPEPVTADDVERAAEGDATSFSETPRAPDHESTAQAAQGGTYAATAGDIATEGPSNETDLGLVDDGDLDATERGVIENAEDSDLDAAVRAVLERQADSDLAQDESSSTNQFTDRPGADLSMTGFHPGGDEETSPSDGPSTGIDASAESSGDSWSGVSADSSAATSTGTDASAGSAAIEIPATPAGSDTAAIIRAGRDRQGADLSRTGLYAGIRGDEDAPSATDDDAWTEGDTSGETGASAAEADSASATDQQATDSPAANDQQATDSPAANDQQATDSAMTRPDVRVRVDDGPGNTEMTAGDDYSAERAAEELPGAAVVSTTAADIGQQMASGEEADDLVGEPPVPDPAPGVAVVAEPTDTVATGSGGYAGAVRGDGTTETPPGYPVKGNASSKIYHLPDMPSYAATKPEWCFATAEDAENAGFRAPRPRHSAGNG